MRKRGKYSNKILNSFLIDYLRRVYIQFLFFVPYHHYRLPVLVSYYPSETRGFFQSFQSNDRTTQYFLSSYLHATTSHKNALLLQQDRQKPSHAKVLPKHLVIDKHFMVSKMESLLCPNSELTSINCNILHIW
jgi:hypothetical protein